MKCMADSKENWHWDLESKRVVTFRLLQKSIVVLEKSWEFFSERGSLYLHNSTIFTPLLIQQDSYSTYNKILVRTSLSLPLFWGDHWRIILICLKWLNMRNVSTEGKYSPMFPTSYRLTLAYLVQLHVWKLFHGS